MVDLNFETYNREISSPDIEDYEITIKGLECQEKA